MDLSQLYMLEMMRKRRLSDTVKEDISWDILVEEGGATHTIRVQCLTGQTANIDWGDGNSTTATATTLTSYAHDYPAGTYTISITGGVYTFIHGVAITDMQRTTLIRNINCANMVSASEAFRSTTTGADYNSACIGFAAGCRFASSITNILECFRDMRSLNGIPTTLQIPAGITSAYRCFWNDFTLSFVPLTLWPTGGFTSTGTIDLRDLFAYCSGLVGAIAPSQILWDSGKTFSVSRTTFYSRNATAWLNYAAAYTDPVSGITYSKIPYAWGGADDKSGDTAKPLTFTALAPNSTVKLDKVGSFPAVSLEYSTGGAWATYTIGTEITLASVGNSVSFRGDNSTFSTTANDYHQFVMTGTIAASGNVMSLVDSTCNLLTIPCDYCFRNLFRDCTSLTTAPALPAMTLEAFCYDAMFEGCTSLTTAPALPATTLAASCYRDMFQGCTSLASAPALPATTLATYCYYRMFQGCTGLTTAPALPATTLAASCYDAMFYGCTSLTTAPALPATTLEAWCYQSMFRGCTSLTTAPALPATTLAVTCYYGMFYGCTSLTTAPALPATTLAANCYYRMFYGCTSLTTAPALPATTLAASCYDAMFYGCTSLTTAPALPATTLEAWCYRTMFYGCSKLSSIEVSFTSWTQETSQTFDWVKNVASSGTFTKPAALATEYGDDRIPTGWTVTDK